MARCSTRGPCAAVSRGTTGRAAGADKDVGSFSPEQDALSKSPAAAHGLAGQESGKRQAGWPFSWVTLSLATQDKSDSVAEGDRPLLVLNAGKPAGSARPAPPLAMPRESDSAAEGRRKLFAL
jgi:hypothetical protein